MTMVKTEKCVYTTVSGAIPYDPLLLESDPAEPETDALFAVLYFLNGRRLQIVGAKGEICTLNLATADDYFDTFITLLFALREKHGRIYIREENLQHLPIGFYPYFRVYRPKDGNGEEAGKGVEEQAGGDEQ
jgi:hypothetical protein